MAGCVIVSYGRPWIVRIVHAALRRLQGASSERFVRNSVGGILPIWLDREVLEVQQTIKLLQDTFPVEPDPNRSLPVDN